MRSKAPYPGALGVRGRRKFTGTKRRLPTARCITPCGIWTGNWAPAKSPGLLPATALHTGVLSPRAADRSLGQIPTPYSAHQRALRDHTGTLRSHRWREAGSSRPFRKCSGSTTKRRLLAHVEQPRHLRTSSWPSRDEFGASHAGAISPRAAVSLPTVRSQQAAPLTNARYETHQHAPRTNERVRR